MDIKYLGHSSFFIKTKNAKIITDPFTPESTGLTFPKTEADILSISHEREDHNYQEGIKGEPLVLIWAGEYEKNEVRIKGFQTFHDAVGGTERGSNIMFKFESGDLSFLHCGDLGHMLSDDIIDEIGSVDVLMIPVGGVDTIDAKIAAKIVNKIEPGMVIPMHFQELEPFLKEMGAEDVVPVDKITVKKEQLNSESVTVVVLKT